MKTLILICVLGIGAFATVASAAVPEERRVPIERVYAPEIFESGEMVEISISGYLPNLCHKRPLVAASIEPGTIRVSVTSLYYSENNPFCPEMATPFLETLALGQLEPGQYRLVVNEGESSEINAYISVVGDI